jgi:drug/metabolite transporter (DMT)-like permease
MVSLSGGVPQVAPVSAGGQPSAVEAWIPVTVAAALLQTWRTALQQRLRGQLSVNAAGFVRYFYAIPLAALMLALAALLSGGGIPAANTAFLVFCAVAGVCQILGTTALLLAFRFRNFAVGTAYAKTEAVQGAVASMILLGERLSMLAWFGIAVGVTGVLVLSLAGRGLRGRALLAATVQPAALCGLGAGFGFALTAIAIKAANHALGSGDVLLQSVFALLVTNCMQTVLQGAWLAVREPAQLRAAMTTWRSSAWVGALSALGSACWWTAFALAPVALVRSLGQIEMVFTLLFSRFYLKERLRGADVAGLVLVVAGVSLILAGR